MPRHFFVTLGWSKRPLWFCTKEQGVGLCLLVCLQVAMAAKSRNPEMDAFIAHARSNGVHKIFLSEMHFRPGNMQVTADVLRAAACMGPVEYWREMSVQETEVAKKRLNGQRTLALQDMLALLLRAPTPLPNEEKEFRRAVSNSNVTVKGIFFAEDKRRDLVDFLESPVFAVAGVGFLHVESQLLNAESYTTHRSRGGMNQNIPKEYVHLSRASLEAMYYGLGRAQSMGVAALEMRPSYFFDDTDQLSLGRKWTYFGANTQDFAVLELPLGRDRSSERPYNMTMFLDRSLIDVIARFTGSSGRWHCRLLEGCPGGYHRDEL